MPFPIYYNGKILFRNGKPAFSVDCCCDEPEYQPCCFDAFNERSNDLDLVVTVRSECGAIDGATFDLPFTGEWPNNVAWNRGDNGDPVQVGGCVSFEILLQCLATDSGLGDFFATVSSDSAGGEIRCVIVNSGDVPIIRGQCSPEFFLEYDAGYFINDRDPEGPPCSCCGVGDRVTFEFRLKNP